MASVDRNVAHGESAAVRLWRWSQSRYVLAGGYALAAASTAVAILLAASPPATGSLAEASTAILTVLGLNLVLVLTLAGLVGWRLRGLLEARASDAGARLHVRFVTLFALAAVAPRSEEHTSELQSRE